MYDFRDELGVPEALIDVLTESQLITESFAAIQRRAVHINSEFDYDEDYETILEANAAPNEMIVGNKVIKLETFRDVWTDYDKYWDLEQILFGLGLTYSDFGSQNRRSVTRKFHVMVKRAYEQGYLDRPVTLRDRKEAYSNVRHENRMSGKTALSRDGSNADGPEDTIDSGSRGPDRSPTGKTIEKINNTDVLPGEFYSNISHIPRSTQRAWWKLWTSKTRRVPDEDGKWRKSFIMGYQVDRNTVFEIWYNTIDSTFTIHNHRGVQISKRYPTVKETMVGMIEMVRTYSERTDPSIRGANNNQIFQSVSRSLSQDVANSAQLKRLGALERADKRRADKEKERRKDQKESGKTNKPAAKPRIATDADRENLSAMWDQDGPSTAARKKDKWIKDLDAENEETRKAAASQKDRKAQMDAAYQERVENMRRQAENRESMDLQRKEREEKQRIEKQRKAQEKLKKEREEDLKRQRELEDATGDIPDPDEADELPVGANNDSGGMPRKNRKNSETPRLKNYDDVEQISNYYDLNDSIQDVFDDNSIRPLNESEDPNNLAQYYQRIGQIQAREERQKADRSAYTKAVINSSDFNELIESYDTTRVPVRGWFIRNLTRIFNGRQRRSSSPDIDTAANGFFKVLRVENNGNSFVSNKYIADFLIGFSLKGIVDIEIWYVSEPNPSQSKRSDDPLPEMVSSYYVYDVTSQTLLRSYLPYYRNAVHVAVDKLSPAMDNATKTKKGYQ